jgi:hypothetical protein
MSSSFTFNERELQRFLDTEVRSAINDLAAKQTRELALQRLFAEDGGNITDPELSEWAQLIHDGTRIEMNAAQTDWNEGRS